MAVTHPFHHSSTVLLHSTGSVLERYKQFTKAARVLLLHTCYSGKAQHLLDWLLTLTDLLAYINTYTNTPHPGKVWERDTYFCWELGVGSRPFANDAPALSAQVADIFS